MKPFTLEIRDLYLKSSNVWNWRRDESQGETIAEDIAAAWRKLYSEEIPSLPEPYDFQKGDLLYVFPNQRYLFIAILDGKFNGAEIREAQDTFFIADGASMEVTRIPDWCFSERSIPQAIARACYLVLKEGREKSWILFHSPKDKSHEPSIIYRSLK